MSQKLLVESDRFHVMAGAGQKNAQAGERRDRHIVGEEIAFGTSVRLSYLGYLIQDIRPEFALKIFVMTFNVGHEEKSYIPEKHLIELNPLRIGKLLFAMSKAFNA